MIAAGRAATLTFGESVRIAIPRSTLIAGAFHTIGPVKILRNRHGYADSWSGQHRWVTGSRNPGVGKLDTAIATVSGETVVCAFSR